MSDYEVSLSEWASEQLSEINANTRRCAELLERLVELMEPDKLPDVPMCPKSGCLLIFGHSGDHAP